MTQPSAHVLAHLRESLLALQERDLTVRAELAADGSLLDGYHPRMEAVHRENALRLRVLIAAHGWPHEGIAGEDGAEAAWLVAQHAIAEPAFMKSCLALIVAELAAGRVPGWQRAYLDDRIQVFEGKLQRFGTQFEMTPEGPVVCALDDAESLEQRRKAAALGPLSQRLKALAKEPRPSVEQYGARKAAEAIWRRKVGWPA